MVTYEMVHSSLFTFAGLSFVHRVVGLGWDGIGLGIFRGSPCFFWGIFAFRHTRLIPMDGRLVWTCICSEVGLRQMDVKTVYMWWVGS